MLRMDMRPREQYLKSLLERYLRASKKGKTAILDEYCRRMGVARKSALRKIAGSKAVSLKPSRKSAPGRPLPGRGIDSANDNAFIKDQLYRYTRKEHLQFTRSRPYRQNDNAYLKQKNFTHIRPPLGYLRCIPPQKLNLTDDLYRNELRLDKNFFQPVRQLERKEGVNGKSFRRYAKPKTPYRILRESAKLQSEPVKALDELYRSLNSAELKRRSDHKLKQLFSLHEKKREGVFQGRSP